MRILHLILRHFMANPLLRLVLGMGCGLGILLVGCAIGRTSAGVDAQVAPASEEPAGVCCPQFTPTPSPSITPLKTDTPTPSITPTDLPGILPDLVIDDFWLHPKTDSCFDPITSPLGARLVVRNAGTADAGPFYVDINGNRQFVEAGLAVGQTVTLWAPNSNPTNSAFVDSTELVAESQESNNQVTKGFPTATPPPSCTPTPTVILTPVQASWPISASVQVSVSNVQIGQTLVVTADSTLGIPQYHLTVIDVATGVAQDPNNPIVTPAQPPLANTNSGPVSWTLTAVRPGTVRFSVRVNGETFGGSCNCFYFTTTGAESGAVAITAAGALPDLVVSSMRIDGNQPCISPSSPLSFLTLLHVTITNNGTGDAGAFDVEANGEQQTVSDGLAAGQSISLMFSRYISQDDNTATADITNLVVESNENNNQRSEQVPEPSPPPACTTPIPTMQPLTYVVRLSPIWR